MDQTCQPPKLLRIPSSTLVNQQDETTPRRYPLIEVNRTQIPNESPSPIKLFRVPIQKENTSSKPVITLTRNQPVPPSTVIQQPRLIDLRSVLKQTPKQFTSKSKDSNVPKQIKTPQLIRVPNIFTTDKQHALPPTQLLESLKHEKPSKKRNLRKHHKDVKIVDMTKEKTKTLVDDKQQQTTPRPEVPRFLTSPPQPSPRRPSNYKPKKRSKTPEPLSDNDDSEISPRKNREDQLFDIINKLLKAKRNKKSRNKRFRLFDIIDNIPITSDDESSNRAHNKYQSFKNRNIENKENVRQLDDTLFNYGLTSFPTAKTKQRTLLENKTQTQGKVDPFPGPGNLSTTKTLGYSGPANIPDKKKVDFQDGQKQKQPSDSWLDLIKSVNQNHASRDSDLVTGVNRDPESWLNLKRTTRLETKETQTEKLKKNDVLLQTKEIQTELKEMIEIPRTQTFFTDHDKMTKKKTDEFCDRVRQEVIKKLEYQESMEDKTVQTICHADTQTESEGVEQGVEQGVACEQIEQGQKQQVVGGVGVCVGTSKSPVVPDTSQRVNIPPSTINDLKLDNGDKESAEKSFIHVSDINDIQEIQSRPPTTLAGETKQSREQRSKTPTKIDEQEKRFSSSRQRKGGRILQNMDDFSYGLQAIEDLQENIERELKSTRMLFKTVETLQQGFDGSQPIDDRVERLPKEENIEKDVKELLSYNTLLHVDDNDGILNAVEAEELKHFTEETIPDQEEKEEENDTDDVINFARDLLKQDGSRVTGSSPYSERTPSSLLHGAFSRQAQDFSSLSALPEEERVISHYTLERPMLNTCSTPGEEYRRAEEEFSLENDFNEKEDEAEKRKKVEAKKEEIRERLQISRMKDDEEKQMERKERDRMKIRQWMKSQHDERNKKYLERLDGKRASEFRPFVSNAKKTFTKRQIDQNMTINDELKRANLEVHNKRRLEAAERLATEINHNNKGNKTRGEATPNSRRKTSINKRYQNTSSGKIPVIRETRSSVMRKTALIADVVRKDRSKVRQQTSKIKASDKSPKKTNNRLLEMSLQSTNTYLDQSCELVNSGAGSPRIQVHPDEFVTGKTYNRYQRHKSPLDRSLEATNWKKLVNRRTETPGDILPSTTYRSQPKQQERESGGRTANEEDLKTLLVSYGLEVDHGLFERNSETSKLLDEVDLALIEESETMNSMTLTNQTVDWNEVDRILNE